MSNTIENVLQMEGVMAKGYGLVAKYPMKDTALKIKDKAIYAYLCSLSGGGLQTFPSRGKILSDLQIGKKAFYNSMDRLLKEGYLTKTERQIHGEHGYWTKCTYTIMMNPKRYQEKKQEPVGETDSTLSMKGMLNDGWGFAPRLVMQDARLSVKEKALYAYIMTYAAVGRVAYPTVETITYHLGISEETYRTAMKNLCKLGYIVRHRSRKKNGQMGGYNYYIPEKPFPVCELTTPTKGDTVDGLTTPTKGDTVSQPTTPTKGDTVSQPTTPMKGDTVGQPTTPTKGDTVSQPPPSKADTAEADTVEAPTAEAPTAKGSVLPLQVSPLQVSLLQVSPLQESSTTSGSAEGRDGEGDLRQRIVRAGGVPIDLLDDENKVVDVLRLLSDGDWKSGEVHYNDKDVQNAYQLVMDTLVTLCTRKTSRINNMTLTREQIVEKLNRCCEKDRYGVFLYDYIQFAAYDYAESVTHRRKNKKSPIRRPAQYAACVIWSSMDSYLIERWQREQELREQDEV